MNRIDRSGTHTDAKLTNNFAVIDDVLGPNRFLFQGPSIDTRAKALAAYPNAPVGSVIFASARIYLRVAAAGANTDFQKVTVSAAD
jgi:hypothetical protein